MLCATIGKRGLPKLLVIICATIGKRGLQKLEY